MVVVLGLTGIFLPEAYGAISYSTPGSTYSQDFNSLPVNTPSSASIEGTYTSGWVDDSTTIAGTQVSLPGWYLWHPLDPGAAENGSNSHQRLRFGTGNSSTGAFYGFATGGATDSEKAFGSLASNTLAGAGAGMYFGLRLNNNTGLTLNSVTITYDGEQWRDGGAATPVAQSLSFMYSTTATAMSDSDALFTTVPSLNFTSPVFANTGSGAAVNGNVAGLVAGITATITGITWAPGTDLWLRWEDINDTGNDHGLAIDNFNFSAIAVPEPSSIALAGFGAAALLISRRRK